MQPISSRLTGPLTLKQRGMFKSEYDLRSADQPVGELVFKGTWRTVATAKSGGGCWTLKEEGVFRTRTLVRRCETEDVVATYHPKAWSKSGVLELTNGKRYFIKSRGLRSSIEIRTSEDASPSITIKIEGIWRTQIRVELAASATSLADLPLLVLFCAYYVVCQQRQAAVAAAA